MLLSFRLRGESLSIEAPSSSTAGQIRKILASLPQVLNHHPCGGVEYLSLYGECGLPLADDEEMFEGERYMVLIHLDPLLRFVIKRTGEVREVYQPLGVLTGEQAYDAFWDSFFEEDEDRDAFVLYYQDQCVYAEDVLEGGGNEIEVQWRIEEELREYE